MEILKSIKEEIVNLDYYKAGKISEAKARRKIKLSSNENLLGSSNLAIKGIKKFLSRKLNIYPDSKMTELKKALVNFFKKHNFDIKIENILFGDGSGEVINIIFSIFLGEDSCLILPEKSFILYYIHARSKGAKIIEAQRKNFEIDIDKIIEVSNKTKGKKVIIFSNPDNPTSTFIKKGIIKEFLSKIDPSIPVIVDEAYIHFAGLENSVIDLIKDFPNLIVIQTFSKAYGLAGLRVGYGIMNEKICEQAEKIRLPFNLGSLQQVGAIFALKDEKFLKKTIDYVSEGKNYLRKEFNKMGIKFLEPFANFFFVDFGEKTVDLINFLNSVGISIRHLVDFGYPENFVRITIGLLRHNKLLVSKLREFYGK